MSLALCVTIYLVSVSIIAFFVFEQREDFDL